MKKDNLQSILVLEDFNFHSYVSSKESVDIYLNFKGEIYSDKFAIKDFTRGTRYKRYYFFIKRYLDKKHWRYNATKMSDMTIGDLREYMWDKNIKSISRNRIEDIVHWENQIGKIRKETIQRIKKYLSDQVFSAGVKDQEI